VCDGREAVTWQGENYRATASQSLREGEESGPQLVTTSRSARRNLVVLDVGETPLPAGLSLTSARH
jgi:hypothetical protein